MEELKNYGEVLEEVKKSLISLVEHEIIVGDYETFLLQLEQAQTIEDCGTVLSNYLQVSGESFLKINIGNYINNTLKKLDYPPVTIDVSFVAPTSSTLVDRVTDLETNLANISSAIGDIESVLDNILGV